MLSKFPKWVWAGGGLLAFSAGMINAVAFQAFAHQAATHVTGVVSHFSIALYESDTITLKQTALIVASFLGGAILSGFILRDAHLKMGRRYGAALAAECFLLLLSTYYFHQRSAWGEYLASMAAGLQNAMASTYSGAIIRTTHLTGIVTDLGVQIGHFARGLKADWQRVRLFCILIFSFTAGGFLGAYFYAQWNTLAMLAPAILIGTASVGYIFLEKFFLETNSNL